MSTIVSVVLSGLLAIGPAGPGIAAEPEEAATEASLDAMVEHDEPGGTTPDGEAADRSEHGPGLPPEPTAAKEAYECVPEERYIQGYMLGNDAAERERTSRKEAMGLFHEAFVKTDVPVYAINRAKVELALNRYDLALLSIGQALDADKRMAKQSECASLRLTETDWLGLEELKSEALLRLSRIKVVPGATAEVCAAGHQFVALPHSDQDYVAVGPALHGGAVHAGRACVTLTESVEILFVPGAQCLDVRRWSKDAPDGEMEYSVLETKFVKQCEVLSLSPAASAEGVTASCPRTARSQRYEGARLHIDVAGEPYFAGTARRRTGLTNVEVLRVEGKRVRKHPELEQEVTFFGPTSSCVRGAKGYSVTAVANPRSTMRLVLRPESGPSVRTKVPSVPASSSADPATGSAIRRVDYFGWRRRKKVLLAVGVPLLIVAAALGVGLGVGLTRDKPGSISLGP